MRAWARVSGFLRLLRAKALRKEDELLRSITAQARDADINQQIVQRTI